MKVFLAAFSTLILVACSEPPAPKVEPKTVEPKAEVKVPEAPKVDPDKALAQRVKKVLEEEAKIQAAGMDVTAKDGAVTLWGTAASVSEMRRAAQAAAKVDGVKSVDNRLQVIRGS